MGCLKGSHKNYDRGWLHCSSHSSLCRPHFNFLSSHPVASPVPRFRSLRSRNTTRQLEPMAVSVSVAICPLAVEANLHEIWWHSLFYSGWWIITKLYVLESMLWEWDTCLSSHNKESLCSESARRFWFLHLTNWNIMDSLALRTTKGRKNGCVRWHSLHVASLASLEHVFLRQKRSQKMFVRDMGWSWFLLLLTWSAWLCLRLA